MKRYTPDPPVLSIITGVPASAKTTISIGLHENGQKVKPGVIDYLAFTYIDKDHIKKSISGGKGYVGPDHRNSIYSIIYTQAEANLSLGNSVWIDSSFYLDVEDPEWVNPYVELTKRTGSIFRSFRCVAPEEVIKQRMTDRNEEADRKKLAEWERFLREEPIHAPLPEGCKEIDTSRPHEENVKYIADLIRNG